MEARIRARLVELEALKQAHVAEANAALAVALAPINAVLAELAALLEPDPPAEEAAPDAG